MNAEPCVLRTHGTAKSAVPVVCRYATADQEIQTARSSVLPMVGSWADPPGTRLSASDNAVFRYTLQHAVFCFVGLADALCCVLAFGEAGSTQLSRKTGCNGIGRYPTRKLGCPRWAPPRPFRLLKLPASCRVGLRRSSHPCSHCAPHSKKRKQPDRVRVCPLQPGLGWPRGVDPRCARGLLGATRPQTPRLQSHPAGKENGRRFTATPCLDYHIWYA